ncbi:hypothetical protein FHU29_003869 [Hoyosella altamirensis]|uniref:Uncharacterized protein n=1 Tax=Hoyosella altamirensis TaxID=616997 RepID=A0A839RS69_9ACTN|nr:hypothetical protein [Hoyosella altamirensis]
MLVKIGDTLCHLTTAASGPGDMQYANVVRPTSGVGLTTLAG